MRAAYLAVLVALQATAQDPSTIVKPPNEGNARVYLAPASDVLQAAQSAAATVGLDAEAPVEDSRFTATLPPGVRKGSGIALTAGRKYFVSLRKLGPYETELSIQEERNFKEEYGGLDYVAEMHRVVFDRLAEKKQPRRVPAEVAGEGRHIKVADPAAALVFKNLEVRPMLQPTAMVGQFFWDVKGKVPPNYSPQSERRFTVVEGKARFHVGTGSYDAVPGDTVVVPRSVRMTVEPLPPAKLTRLVALETPSSDPSKAIWIEKDALAAEWADPYDGSVDAGVAKKKSSPRDEWPPRSQGGMDGYPGERCGGGCGEGMSCCNTGRAGSYACMRTHNGVCPPRM